MTQAKLTTRLEELPDPWLECRRSNHHLFEVTEDYHVLEAARSGRPFLVGLTQVCARCDTVAYDTYAVKRLMRGVECLERVGTRSYRWPRGYLIPTEDTGPLTTRDWIKAEIWKRALARMQRTSS